MEKVIKECFVEDMLGKVALNVVHEEVNVFEDGGEDEVALAEGVVVCGEPRILLKIR